MFIFTFYWMVSVSWVVSVVSHSIGWHYNTMMVMVVWHPYSSTTVLVLALQLIVLLFPRVNSAASNGFQVVVVGVAVWHHDYLTTTVYYFQLTSTDCR